ncbi:MAG TPA: hypothetical protein VLT61_00590 [Anaeromyxobacteraceae bacterium]|nr:hypothetical protein [Anaeromyxobacteraceae bacterium]
MPTEVRTVGEEAFDQVYPLVARFPTRRMTRECWRWLLFGYPWAAPRRRGWLLVVNGAAVGFMGAVFSERPLLGRAEKFCNPTSWIVLPEHRWAAGLLVRPIIALTDHTIVSLTPSPSASRIFSRQGLRELETTQLVIPPLPRPGEAARALRGSFTVSPSEIDAELTGAERAAHRDHATSPAAHHALLRRDGRSCYVVATLGRRRRIPYADVQYVGDREFFWEHRILVQAALARAMGVAGLVMAVDGRLLVGSPPPLSLRWKVTRLYRPTREEIVPALIDGLYSELMGLRF